MKQWQRRILGTVALPLLVVVVALEVWYHSLLPVGFVQEPPTPLAPFFVPDAIWVDSCRGEGVPSLPRSRPFPLFLLTSEADDQCLALLAERMLDPAPRPRRTLERIPHEAALATWIARHWTAEEALQFVANNVWIGADLRGVDAGAALFFGRSIDDLTLAEAAVLVALVRSPAALDPRCHPDRARNARNAVLDRLLETGRITAAQRGQAVSAPLGVFSDCPSRPPTPNRS